MFHNAGPATIEKSKLYQTLFFKTVTSQKHLKARAILYYIEEAINSSFIGFGSDSNTLI